MQIIKLLPALAAAAFTVSACTTAPTAPSPEVYALALRATVATSATLALQKNPTYVPAVRALATGIDAAVKEFATITPEGIAAFVHTIAQREHLADEQTALFVMLAEQIYAVYVAAYKTTVIESTDPRALRYIGAFRDGLNDALAGVPAAG